jgi:hypothetical protein
MASNVSSPHVPDDDNQLADADGSDQPLQGSTTGTLRRRQMSSVLSLDDSERASTGPPKKSRKTGPTVTAQSSRETRSTTKAKQKGKQKEIAPPAPSSSATHMPAPSSTSTFAPAFGSSKWTSKGDHGLVGTSAGGSPSTSAGLTLPPETITHTMFRPRPPLHHDEQGPPPFPDFIHLFHPVNDLEFLILPAYDRLGPNLQFGLHHETVVTACMIVACNRSGYLSKFRNRDAAHVDVALDSLLLPGTYYYHLDDTKTGELYPICRDFENWRFPHGRIPASWSVESSTGNQNWPSNWTALSQKIKDRDTTCLISRATESLTTAHVVPNEDNEWVCKICIFYLSRRPNLWIFS